MEEIRVRIDPDHSGGFLQLVSGMRLGAYEIRGPLGAGGMGEVYRATDPKLQRDVAIKILPEAFAHDSDRVSRFQREAQILASLNHPNIGVIYDLQESAATRYLVLELIDGETLASRLKRGPLRVDEALEVCKQVAEALEAAHEKEVLHRDLKPANIQITREGRVKVLDFGLAKMMATEEPAAATTNSPTIMTSPHTGGGIILGTAAYMSPEQARGRALDRRTDMWAFGCVLFETLTGRQVFEGEDVTEIISTIVKGNPDWSTLPQDTPATVRSLLRQCLQKQPRNRLHDAGAARIAIEDALTTSEEARPGPRAWLSPKWMLPVLAASVIAGAVGAWMLKPSAPEDRAVSSLLLDVRPAERFVGSAGGSTRPSRTAIALSPDGRTVVFGGFQANVARLFKRNLGEREATPMEGTERARGPFFSPDGRWVGFWADDKLKKISIAGGPPVDISDAPMPNTFGLYGASWGSNDIIAFSSRDGIMRVDAGGGTPAAITKTDAGKSEGAHILPYLLPGGKALLFTSVPWGADWEGASIILRSLETNDSRTLISGGADARYISTGHLLYMKNGVLMAVGFDLERLQVKGSPIALMDNVMQAVTAYNTGDETGAGQFSVSESGTLAYLAGGIYPAKQDDLVWVDRKGTPTRIPVPAGSFIAPRVSPDGRHVAYFARRGRSKDNEIWVYDIARETPRRVTLDDNNSWVTWSPDSKNLVFGRIVSGILNLTQISADGSGAPQPLLKSEYPQQPASWSITTNILTFLETRRGMGQVWVLPMEGAPQPRLFLESVSSVSYPALSPDGRWMAYVLMEQGRPEVFVRPYSGGGEMRISPNGGNAPVWGKTGRELFYLQPSPNVTPPTPRMMVATTDTVNGQFEVPRVLFDNLYLTTVPLPGFDAHPDGQRFIMVRPAASSEPPFTQMNIILNWTEELKRVAP